MISNDELAKIINDCAKKGFSIKVRDISFYLLSSYFDDINVVYKIAFGVETAFVESEVIQYIKSKSYVYLQAYMNDFLSNGDVALRNNKKGRRKNNDDITFEENKAYMLKLKKDTENALKEKKISTKDALKILSEISVKLNDKFNIQDSTKDQIVFVNQKYDTICPYCMHEVASQPMTKEEAKKKYNLIDNTK